MYYIYYILYCICFNLHFKDYFIYVIRIVDNLRITRGGSTKIPDILTVSTALPLRKKALSTIFVVKCNKYKQLLNINPIFLINVDIQYPSVMFQQYRGYALKLFELYVQHRDTCCLSVFACKYSYICLGF